ncbi:ATP-binding protein [Sphingomonas kaistensis]|uniref:ATP-binding protein n=1 Tax=Sphingomonas kaistensis TaxID=298708 RepID=A0ABZ2FXB3_9SPHN
MIRKDLDEITAEDLATLCTSSRAEDERIEFKESFTGGADLSAMSESQRDRALDNVAREITAFLNAGGGDLIIGIREHEGLAAELLPLPQAVDAAERLRRSLPSRIEPSPRALRIRSIAADDRGSVDGYIVARADSSLQAPHRVARSNEFYIRRGTETLPMSIAEVHDLTLSVRTAAERIDDKLKSELSSVREFRANNRIFQGGGFQFRVVYVPLQPTQISLEGKTLAALTNAQPVFYRNGTETRNDVAFRRLGSNWRPVLRGKLLEDWIEGATDQRAGYASKRVHTDGTVVFDWFVRYIPEGDLNSVALHIEWYQGFLAEICRNLLKLRSSQPNLNPGIVGVAMRNEPHSGNLPHLLVGSSMFQEQYALPRLERVHQLPNFMIVEDEQVLSFFTQAQEDLFAIAGTTGEIASLMQLGS